MKDYRMQYEKLTGKLRAHERSVFVLQLFNNVFTAAFYVLYFLLVIYTAAYHAERLAKMILVPGSGFALLSFLRGKIGRKRPYEAWDFMPLIPKESEGNSFPSRHLYSAAVISMALMCYSVPAGIASLVLSAAEAAVRVIGGVHYPSDVICGFMSGIAFGTMLFVL